MLYLTLPGGERGSKQRLALFDSATQKWCELSAYCRQGCVGRSGTGYYDAVDGVVLLVIGNGVWAYKPPNQFTLK